MARICVIGAWHQASVLGACFAELGHTVTGVWPDPESLAAMLAGRPPVFEPGLAELVTAQRAAGRLRYTADFADGLRGAEFAFLAIDTPVGEDDAPDVAIVVETAARVGRALGADIILCTSAQVPVGTTTRVAARADEESKRWHCTAAYVPEFLRLGAALQTFREADRIVIGCDDANAARRIAELYAGLARPVVLTDVRSAEMAKHACNAFLATSISFVNELAGVCEASGARMDDVVQIMKLDHRIGAHAFLAPGMGFAGGTLGRDVRALQALAAAAGGATRVLDAVMRVNAERVAVTAARLERALGGLSGARIGILGLTYKPGTSTLRRSVALDLIVLLDSCGAHVRAYDPLADFTGSPDLPDFAWCHDAEATADGADALVLMTEWPALRELDLAAVAKRMRRPVLLDTRDFFDENATARAGLVHLRIGHASAVPDGQVLRAGMCA